MEFVIMKTIRKIFLLTYVTILMDGEPLQKDLGTLADTTSAERLLSWDYYLPVDVGDHIEVALKTIQQVSDKVNSG